MAQVLNVTFLLLQLKHGVVIPAPTTHKGKARKERASVQRFTTLRHLWCLRWRPKGKVCQRRREHRRGSCQELEKNLMLIP